MPTILPARHKHPRAPESRADSVFTPMEEPGHSATFQHIVDVTYMVVPALVLFFAPLLNGFLGGVAGGFRAGTFRRALPAVVAAAVSVPAVLFLLYSFPGAVLGRFFSGLGFEGFALLNAVGLLLGAVTGVLCNPRSDAHLPRFLRFHGAEAPSMFHEDMMTAHPARGPRSRGTRLERSSSETYEARDRDVRRR